jgi:peptidoglycan/LPS O-acetylase OafA/YrhL
MKKKYYTIELLRFFSSLGVIFFHYKAGFAWNKGFVSNENLTNTLPLYEYLNILYNYGFYGVQFFFAISGFVFSHIYLNKNRLVSSKEFFINRFARLYPLHFATLVILIFYKFIDPDFINQNFNLVKGTYFDFYHFFLNIFFIHSWGFEKGWSFNPPSWSISVEIGVYIIFFLFISFLKTYKIKLSLAIVVLLFIFYKIPLLHFKYSEFILLFFIGVAVNQLKKKIKGNTVLILSVIFLCISFYGRNFKILLFCPSLLIIGVIMDNYVNNSKVKNLFSFLGNTTYSLYLLHYPFMFIFLWLETRYIFFKDFYQNYFFFLFYLSSLVAISASSFYFFERPFNQKIRAKFL